MCVCVCICVYVYVYVYVMCMRECCMCMYVYVYVYMYVYVYVYVCVCLSQCSRHVYVKLFAKKKQKGVCGGDGCGRIVGCVCMYVHVYLQHLSEYTQSRNTCL